MSILSLLMCCRYGPVAGKNFSSTFSSPLLDSLLELDDVIGDGLATSEPEQMHAHIEKWCNEFAVEFEALCEAAILKRRRFSNNSSAHGGDESLDGGWTEENKRDHDELSTLLTAILERKEASKSNELDSTKVKPPRRLATAICAHVLDLVLGKLGHFQHVRDLRTELMRSIFSDFDQEEDADDEVRCNRFFLPAHTTHCSAFIF